MSNVQINSPAVDRGLSDGDAADRAFNAAWQCPHEIDKDSIVLFFDPKQPGHNALNQLHRRIETALAASAPSQAKPATPIKASTEWRGNSHLRWTAPTGLAASNTTASRTLTEVVNSMPTTWELSWGGDDEEAPCNWRVHDCSGSRNDREWKLIGEGATPADAILAASSTTAGVTRESAKEPNRG